MQRVAVFNIGSSNKKVKEIYAQLSKKDSNLHVFNMFLLKIDLSILDKPLFGKSAFKNLLELCNSNLIEVIVEADFAEYIYFTGYEVSTKNKKYFNSLIDEFKVKHVSVVSHKELDVISILSGPVNVVNLYNANDFCSDSKQSLHVRSPSSATITLYAALVPMNKLTQSVSFEKIPLKYTEGKAEDKTCIMYKTIVDKKVEYVLVNRHENKEGVAFNYILRKGHLPADILPNLTELNLPARSIRSIEI